jgi:thiamine biosynthesis protein ThiS
MKGEIFANGKRYEVELPCTVEMFLAGRGLKATQVVVELNGEALERGRFGEIKLKAGDKLEVVLPVAGG